MYYVQIFIDTYANAGMLECWNGGTPTGEQVFVCLCQTRVLLVNSVMFCVEKQYIYIYIYKTYISKPHRAIQSKIH
jgi:hypothetical protein